MAAANSTQSTRKSYDAHPLTSSYVAGDNPDRQFELAVFERGLGGDILHPILARDPDAGDRMARGWHLSGGLWLSRLDDAASWTTICENAPMLDLSLYELESKHSRNNGCDWKIFMEIYFDDYHVEPFHPGLSSMADCGALNWLWAPRAQAQVVGASVLRGSGSSLYSKFDRLCRQTFGAPEVAAVWAAIYPSCMVEWLGGCLALSVAEPAGAGESINHVAFAYPKGVAESQPELVAAHQAAYWETALEDDEIARRIQSGRDCLSRRGEHEAGPAHPHLEAGIVKFHEWLSEEMGRRNRKPHKL